MNTSIPLLLFIAPIAGWVAGALANWAADVLPSWSQASHSAPIACAATGTSQHPAFLHYLTLVWYFPRRGVCPHCERQRTRRAPVIEAALIVLFVLMAFRYAATPVYVLVAWCYVWYLMAVLVIDVESRRVLNIMLVPAALFTLAVSLLLDAPSLPSIVAGGIVGFGLFWLLYIVGRLMFGRGALGFGDVKLAGVIGLMVGYPDIMRALVVGAVLGGVAAIFLLATRRAGLKTTSAYAPYLALGAIISIWSVLGT